MSDKVEAQSGELLHGTLQSINYAPRGEVDGLLLKVDGKVVQVNVKPEAGARFVSQVGQEIDLQVGPEPKVAEHPKGEHVVHALIEDGQASKAKPPKPGPKHKDDKEQGEDGEVTGKILRFNYAKHGEANGVVLETDEFIHLKPDGMKQAKLKVGQAITASGKITRSPSGARVVEARKVNGVEIGPKKH